MGNTKKAEKLPQKVDEEPTSFSYTHSYELSDRTLYLDVDYLRNEEGRFKIIEISLCFLAIFLSAEVRGLRGERGLAMIVSATAILLTVGVWCTKVMTLHRNLHPGNWCAIEFLVNIFIIAGLLVATAYMTIYATIYWTIHNPQWQTFPLLATVALFGAAVVYALDLILVFRHRRDRTYIPNVSTYQT